VELNLRARVRAGDPEAFGVLFDECARSVYNHAFRLTGNWSTAEEVVSLTFLEAWRLCGTVRPDGGSLRPWVLGIAVNVTRNVSRAARRHRAALSRLPVVPAVPDFADELAGRIDDAARLETVRSALGMLRRNEREVLALCVWSGLDYAAAAEALKVPVGTVRSRLSRARRRLRDLAATEDGEPGEPGERGAQDRELRPGDEQVRGSRENAARPTQERAR
jgi:RNA polymerase sigma-70 factor (ECF subfamily)